MKVTTNYRQNAADPEFEIVIEVEDGTKFVIAPGTTNDICIASQGRTLIVNHFKEGTGLVRLTATPTTSTAPEGRPTEWTIPMVLARATDKTDEIQSEAWFCYLPEKFSNLDQRHEYEKRHHFDTREQAIAAAREWADKTLQRYRDWTVHVYEAVNESGGYEWDEDRKAWVFDDPSPAILAIIG